MGHPFPGSWVSAGMTPGPPRRLEDARSIVCPMRLAWVVFGLALAAFAVFPVSDVGAAVAGLVAVALLPVLGYRDGTMGGMRFALIVPAAAVVADVITFTPLSLQPETDVAIYTYVTVFYLPAWALLVWAGIGASRLHDRRRRLT
jgi:hypothetical protein